MVTTSRSHCPARSPLLDRPRSPVELVFHWSGPGNDYARSLEKSGVSAPAPLPDRG
ncbi:hypothetical protein H6F46_01130 [Limnothrix sp. FACHB-1083]|uniref:hypothetical protein n=1 Tax=unclassified Limnothrix TaxID=2632864 RepID=UPI001681A087|nr:MULTISPECIES: hypothetical protein [unclassified Limnothrix]MBD2159288.1 hypothetical protein [Limnothrix sp. FACHB-1083]MBD2191993.1 hypothetical protein [Limnothrix sp. FACHB-1088]